MRRLIILAGVLAIGSAFAIEPPKTDTPPPAPPGATPPTAPAPDAEPSAESQGTTPPVAPEADAEEEEETLPPLPADAAPAGPPAARFNPTEKVRADFPVSFPIDI